MNVLSWALALYAGSTLVAMAPMNIGVALFLGAFLLISRGRGFRFSVTSRRYFRISLLLAVACISSLFFAGVYPASWLGQVPHISLLKDGAKLWYLFLPLAVAVALEYIGLAGRERVFRVWIFVFAAMSAVGIVQYFTGWPRPQPIPSLPGRFHATLGMGHHLSVASIFIFPFFAALDRASTAWRLGRRIESAWLGLAVFLGGTTLFLTYSRTVWVVLPLGLVGWLLWRLPRRSAVASIVVLTLLGIWGLRQDAVYERLLGTNIGISTRQDLWRANIDFFKTRPLSGVGFRHNEEMSGYYLREKLNTQDVFAGHAHNNFLEMLGGTGAPGALIWLCWSGFLFFLFWKGRLLPHSFAGGLFFAWFVFHLNGLTQVNFWEGKVQHQVAFVVGWALFWAKPEKKETRQVKSSDIG